VGAIDDALKRAERMLGKIREPTNFALHGR
jgi:hypothetical protein